MDITKMLYVVSMVTILNNYGHPSALRNFCKIHTLRFNFAIIRGMINGVIRGKDYETTDPRVRVAE